MFHTLHVVQPVVGRLHSGVWLSVMDRVKWWGLGLAWPLIGGIVVASQQIRQPFMNPAQCQSAASNSFSLLAIAVAALRNAGEALSKLDPMAAQHDAQLVDEAIARTRTVFVAAPESLRNFMDSLPDEQAITSYITDRIDDGNMDMGDVTKCMARYGLMDPIAFAVEMQERMGEEQEENTEGAAV